MGWGRGTGRQESRSLLGRPLATAAATSYSKYLQSLATAASYSRELQLLATATAAASYHKSAVDLLQDLLLVQRHRLSFPLLDPLLLQLLAGVHFAGGSYLTGAHLKRARKETQLQRHTLSPELDGGEKGTPAHLSEAAFP